MRKPGYCLCCVGEDGTEDLFWFSQEAQVTEDTAKVKFQHDMALIPPEIGLRLYRTGSPGEGRQLLTEKTPVRKLVASSRQAV
jgi:hypothetical protein